MMVYDVQRDAMVEVTPAEARAGMMRYARSLGPGTAACGVWERRALSDEPWCNHDAPAVRNGVCECGEVVQPTCTELACPDCDAPAGKPCQPWCIADQAVPAV